MNKSARLISVIVALCFAAWAFSCGSKSSDKPPKEGTAGQAEGAPNPATLEDFQAVENGGESPEMTVVLEDGSPQGGSDFNALDRPETSKLSAQRTKALLARMSDLQTEADDRKDFAKRERSLPPPKTRDTIETSFPPKSQRDRPDSVSANADAELKVARYAPDGEVPIAPKVSVTFNQPMVAVTSHDDSVAGELPVRFEPKPEGQWRWIGTKTLLFEPVDERLPMATKYSVSIPEGTKSVNGQTMKEAQTFEFETPPVKLAGNWPNYGTHGLETVMFLSLDQRIEPEKLIEHIELRPGTGPTIAPRLATEFEIEENAQVQAMASNALDQRWIAVRAPGKLPYNSSIRVVLKEGAPSAEGPLTTEADQSFSFQTYGPLEVIEHRCNWNSECKPNSAFNFRLSNRIDHEAFTDDMITVAPDYPAKTISYSGNWVNVAGMKPGRKTYTVTLSKDITDEFGQKLGEDKTFTFDVTGADPALYSTSGNFVVLDPSDDKPGLTIFTTNYESVRLVARKVQPADFGSYLGWLRDYRYYGKKELKPPGKAVIDRVIEIDGERDDLTQTKVELASGLNKSGFGNLVVEVTGGEVTSGATPPRYKPKVRTWIQSTDIALDAFVEHTDFIAWASDLASGEPIEGVEFELGASGVRAQSSADGTATLELPSSTKGKPGMLIARKGDDTAFLPRSVHSPHTSGFNRDSQSKTWRWFVFDDRGMYKPDEEVHLKGWVRAIDYSEGGGVGLADGARDFSWKVYGPQNNELASGKAKATSLGGFSFDFKLPKTPNLGRARAEITSSGRVFNHYFQIQEFRTPEFEVTASAGEGPFFADEVARATVEAKYYAGGALPGADVNWNVRWTAASFTPPNRGEFTFGTWTPWWRRSSNSSSSSNSVSLQGKTDAAGIHYLDLKTSEIAPPRPMSVTASASVTDVNRQQWASQANLLVHPSQFYVGLKTEKYFVEKGKPLEVDVIVADVDGNLATDRPVKVRASRVKWAYKGGEYVEELVDTQNCDFNTPEAGDSKPHRCSFETSVGGTYKISATTSDDYGRLNYTEFTRWVSGGKRPSSRRVTMEEVQLIPDRDEYQPGDVAKLLVQAPFVPAEGLLTIRRSGIEYKKRVTMREPTMVLDVPIKNHHLPNVHVALDLIGNTERLDENGEPDSTLPRRPAIASGEIDLKVPPSQRALDVEIKPAEARVEPGSKTYVDVVVTRQNGDPVANAEVALVVVDEAILALSSYQMGDPLSIFYPHRPDGVSEHHLRPFIELVDPKALKAAQAERSQPDNKPGQKMKRRSMQLKGSGRGGGGTGEETLGLAMKPSAAPMEMEEAAMALGDSMDADAPADPSQSGGAIAVRSNFNPLAAFAPSVKTGAGGKARVDIEMPDNLTRYRIMAVAVEGGEYYGTGESNVTARLPLMVRPSAPRFLNFGDEFQFPVVLQNQTEKPVKVEVAMRAANLDLDSPSGVGYSLTVPADNRVEVRFPASADMAGTARFQIAASTGKWADAAEGELPVWTPATSEAFATYGEIDKGSIAQPVKMPEAVWPQFGALTISTSSTALQALTDAFIYLYDYDYQCAEQISSRMISVAALRDVLDAFEAEGMPDKADVERSMKRDIEELSSRQNYDGGFGFWRKGQRSWPYVSLHATHALLRAEEKGYEVPAAVKNRMIRHMKTIERYIPSYYSEWTRRHIIAYSLYVRGLAGDWDTAKAADLMKRAGKLENLTFEATGWLLGVFANGGGKYDTQRAEIRRFLGNRVTETAGNAHFAAQMNDGHHLIMHSNRRADGIILEALMDDQPRADLIPKIVKGLMAHRVKGRWGNTQENAFVLLALDKYFRIYEKTTPDFVARAWLGERFAGEHTFKGRTTETHEIDIPMKYVDEAAAKGETLYLQKDGKGRMYYRIGMTYAPKSLELSPADHGFVVERTYKAVDDPADVKRRADGTWEIKAGAKVKIELTMVAETRRYHVALVDPLPAGLETMNPALAVTGDIPDEAQSNTGRSNQYRWWWFSRPWYEHQNMRDERTEAFTTLLWGGVHKYTYFARATTPGTFVVPPAKAEEMYHPETFGRSASEKVEVVDRK